MAFISRVYNEKLNYYSLYIHISKEPGEGKGWVSDLPFFTVPIRFFQIIIEIFSIIWTRIFQISVI